MALLLAVVGGLAIGGLLIAVVCLPYQAGSYTRDHAAARPLHDRTQAPW
jgi:hypothetical protein